MTETQVFDDVVLTSSYEDMGEKLCSDKQRLLFEALSLSSKLLYCAGWGGVTSTDLYGPIQIQSFSNEDRLFFPKNQAHVHVKWSQICVANPVKWQDHPAGKDCHWIGIEFLTSDRQPVFSIWNLKADQEFSPEVREHLGTLL